MSYQVNKELQEACVGILNESMSEVEKCATILTSKVNEASLYGK